MEQVWDALACHGAPLMVLGEETCSPREDSLQQSLISAIDDLENRPQQPAHFRKTQALESLLLALHDHYPAVFQSLPQRVQSGLPKQVEGRHIKMRRIASARLAVYL